MKETIRAEIERRRLHFNKEAEKYQALNNGYSQNCYGARDALRDLENFLDTLPEQPEGLNEVARHVWESWNGGTMDDVRRDMKALGNVLNARKEQPASEDERIRKAIEIIIRVYGKTQGEWIAGYDMDTLVVHSRGAFAYLEKQKEQKPAEWSEEDEKIRKTLLDYYEEALDNYTGVEWLNGITYGELCDWLKSLRPSWKLIKDYIIYKDQ